jgi:hypothetical protein
VDVPEPAARGADVDAVCAALGSALPDEVDPGVERRPVSGDEDRTAAWGDPPVTLQCGVDPPERLEPPVVVNGVAWTVRDIGPGFRWTTSGRTVLVAVTIPDEYTNGVEIVFPLSPVVEEVVPVDPDAPDVTAPPPDADAPDAPAPGEAPREAPPDADEEAGPA